MNETASPLLKETLRAVSAPLNGTLGLSQDDWEESNLKHGINGYLYCNMPGLTAEEGDR